MAEKCECGHRQWDHHIGSGEYGRCKNCHCAQYRPALAEPTFPNERDCDHGQLRRQCEICDLKAALREARASAATWGRRCAIAVRERNKARAEVERLRLKIEHAPDNPNCGECLECLKANLALAQIGHGETELVLEQQDRTLHKMKKRAEQAEADKETLAKWLSSAEAKLLDADAKAERLRAETRRRDRCWRDERSNQRLPRRTQGQREGEDTMIVAAAEIEARRQAQAEVGRLLTEVWQQARRITALQDRAQNETQTKENSMKRIVETNDDAWTDLLGQEVVIWCMNYIYTGKLVAVNATHVQLTGARVVYETGPLDAKEWQDAQSLPQETWNVALSAVESFGLRR